MICYIIRGLSGAGKSTLAEVLTFSAGIESRPKDYICSADDYFMVGDEYKFDVRLLGEAHRKCFSKFLNLVRSKASVVIVANTSVNFSEVIKYYTRARKEGYEVVITEPDNEAWSVVSKKLNSGISPTDAELMPLVRRNVHGVTLDIMRRRIKAWTPHDKLMEELEAAYVEKVDGLPNCVICDIDGTVALKGSRNAYDWTNVGADSPNFPVINILEDIISASGSLPDILKTHIIFLSGRDGVCYNETREWLNNFYFKDCELYLRSAGDSRKDSVVKRELFDKHIRNKFNVSFVLDDRDQVCDLWRNELGLTCFQVQEGDF